MTKLNLSVVIPSYNRRELLAAILETLNHVDHLPGEMEVIVVDDGSQDDTPQMLAKRKDNYPLKSLRHDVPLGPAAARNAGVKAARGEIIGFLDSDVLAEPGWWLAAKPRFDDPHVAIVEGATLLPPGSPQPTPFSHFVSNLNGNSFQTCNLFCRKNVFEQVGGFDERFSWRTFSGKLRHVREDTDLAFAVLEHGYNIVFEPQAKAFHPVFSAARDIYFQKTFHGPYEALLRRKHPELYRKHLKWIDGRAFPVFYWGIYLGLTGVVMGVFARWPLVTALAMVGFCLGWVGSVYAVCRKRRTTWTDLFVLGVQFLLIPWVRLFWVAVGEWKYRKIKPVIHRRDAEKSK